MARIDTCHWCVDTADTWQSIAVAAGCTKADLLTINGLPTSEPAPNKGRIIHIPPSCVKWTK